MNRDLRKCYEYLDLPFTATEEDVALREKALLKVLNSESVETKVSSETKKKKIKDSAQKILNNIKNNGLPKEKDRRFDSSWQSIGILFVVLCCVTMVCFFSFYILL